ncbi:MAG: Fur family transcriptional regulator [Sphaerochaetaceae bacterium]
MTKYAQRILDIISSSCEHPTVEQVFWKMKEDFPGVVLSTVYNNMNALTEKGLIRRISVEGSPDHYDNNARHDHLICSSCGGISDVVIDDLTRELEDMIGEKVISYDLKIKHICPKCREAGRAVAGNVFHREEDI